MKNVSSCDPAYRPRYVKNRIWKSGLPSIVVTYMPGLIQLNSARYEIPPADEEDPERRGHVSESVARLRARRSKFRSATAPSTR